MRRRRKELWRFILNISFAVYTCALGIASHSWWFLSMGAYYMVLGGMRMHIIAFSQKNRQNEKFVMRLTGSMLFVLSVVLCGIVYMTVGNLGAVKYPEITMITIALYTFIKLTLAIISIAKAKGRRVRPHGKALRSIAFTDSLVSLYSLQRSMLVSFGGMARADIVLFNAISGVCMCLAVVGIGVNLMTERKRKMAKSKFIKANEKIAEGVCEGFKKIEETVVDGYKKIEDGVVHGYTKMEDAFVERYLTHEGESVEEAKARRKGKKE